MFIKTITAAAFAIGMSTSAFAQTTGTEAMDPAGAGMPSGWDQTTSDAFFSDSATGTLRSQDEIQSNWGTLSDEQQASVRAHCATMSADAGAGGAVTGDAGATDDTTTGSTTDEATGAEGGTAGMTDGAAGTAGGVTAGGQTAAMTELCDWVETQ